MSVDLEAELRVLLASAPQNIREIQVLELSHSAMTQTHYFWSQRGDGVVETEDGAVDVRSVAFQIDPAGTEAHLDQVYKVTLSLTDNEDEFYEELDRIPLETQERIRCVLRSYLSNDLTNIMARADLQVEDVAHQLGAATFTAVSPRMNTTRTGSLYSARDLPMLRGLT